MNSKVELIFQKNNIGLGKRKQSSARVFLVPGEGNLIINKVSGDKYLQYNDSYLNLVWTPLEKLNLEKILILSHWSKVVDLQDKLKLFN